MGLLSVLGLRSVDWIIRMAEAGDSEEQFVLGDMYFNGKRVKQNFAEAKKWFGRAAEQGLADGQYWYGVMHVSPCLGILNLAKAIPWWQKAAQQGHSEAIRQLKKFHVPLHIPVESESDQLLIEAKCNHARAQYLLGKMNEEGSATCGRNLIEAYKFYRLAAAQVSIMQISNRDSLEDQLPQLAPEGLERVKQSMSAQAIAEAERRAIDFLDNECYCPNPNEL